MSFGLTYRSNWQSVEGHNMELNIWDRLNDQGGPRPYNISWIGDLPGNGYNVEFTFDDLPSDSTGLVIQASIPGTNIVHSFLGSTASPRQISLPYSNGVNWQYRFLVQNPGQGINIDLSILYPKIVPIKVVKSGVELTSIDSDDKLYKIVKSKQLNLTLVTDQNFGLATFRVKDAFDDRFYVTLQKNGRFIFKGYLILDEVHEPFLSGRNQFSLCATDRLATLKTIDLKDANKNNPRGQYRMIEFISMALKGTGLNLPINVVMNIREESSAPLELTAEFLAPARIIVDYHPFFKEGRTITISNAGPNNIAARIDLVTGPIAAPLPNQGKYQVYFPSADVSFTPGVYDNVRFHDTEPHMYHRVFLDAKTFETEINKCEDSYRVLEKIIGVGCFITQEKGEWWIKRHNETALNPIYVTTFDADGNYITSQIPTAYSKGIGQHVDIKHVDKATHMYLNRPRNSVHLTYNYTYPKELICNIDYKRGDVIPGEEPDKSQRESSGKYELECWTLRSNNPAIPTRAVIYRKFAYGNETERFIVFEKASGNNAQYLESSKMPVRATDRINFSVDYKYNKEVQTGSGFYRNAVAQIRLYGNNGSHYILHGGSSFEPDSIWIPTNENFSDSRYIVFEGNASGDEDKEWRTATFWDGGDSPNIPVDGFISIVLVHEISTDDAEKHFANINLQYIPCINGTYKKMNGVQYSVTQPANEKGAYMAKEDEISFIGDAWSRNFKGALLVKDGDNFEIAGRFYDACLNQDLIVDESELKTYLEIIAFDFFNQYNYPTLTWRAHLKGLQAETDELDRDDTPGLLHRYRMLDPSPNSGGSKWNHLIAFSQDFDMCKWTGTFREVWDFNEPRSLDKNLLTIEYKEE